MKKCFLIFAMIFLVFTIAISAQIPRQISWQGVLTDDSGDALNGQYDITVRIFSSDDIINDLTPLWQETYTLDLTDGLFNIIIGENSNNPLNLAFDSQYWMEVEVDGDDDPLPRIKLTSVPYSLMSKTVEDDAITAPKIANGAVTNAKIADGAVTSAKIGTGEVEGGAPGFAAHIAVGSIGVADIGFGQVQGSTVGFAGHIAAGSIATADIANDAVTSAKIGAGEVEGSAPGFAAHIAAGSIAAADLADGAVTNAKIANGAVTSTKIGGGQVFGGVPGGPAHIAPASIVGGDIANGQVVRSIGKIANLTDHVNLVEGANIKIIDNFPNANDIEISALRQLKIEVDINNYINIYVLDIDLNIWVLWLIIFPGNNIWWFGPLEINNYIWVYNENNYAGILIHPESGITLYDEYGNVVGRWRLDGTSEHWGDEIFHGRIIKKNEDGSTTITDGTGVTSTRTIEEQDQAGRVIRERTETNHAGFDGNTVGADETTYGEDGNVDKKTEDTNIQKADKGEIKKTEQEFDAEGNKTTEDVGTNTATSEGVKIEKEHREYDDQGNVTDETYESSELTSGGLTITCPDGSTISINCDGITMKDANGNVKSRTGSDGTSYHAGLEEFAGGLKVPFTDGGWLQATETGFEIYDPTGELVGGFYTDGSLINANISLDNGFTIPLTDGGSFVANSNGWGFYDSESNLVTGYFADGTSYHSGLETFAGGLEVPSSGGGNTTISPTGVTLYHPESNTTTTISGTTTQVSYLDSYLNEGSTEVDAEGVTTTFTDSFGETSSTELTAYGLKYTNEDGETIEIGPYGITIRDAEGNVMTNFSWNGSSYHAGLEEFAGGAFFPNEDGGDLWIDGSGVRIYDELGYEKLVIGNDGSVRIATNGGWATVDDNGISLLDGQGNVITNFSPNGTSTHTGLETYNGGLFVPPNNASPQNGVPGTTLTGNEVRVTDGNTQTGAVITAGEGRLSNDVGESVTTTPKQIIVRIENPDDPPSTEIPETKIEAGKIDVNFEGSSTKIEGDYVEFSHLRLFGKDPSGVPEPDPIIHATNHLGDDVLRLNQYGELSGMNLNYPNGQINNLNSQFIETQGIGAETGNFTKATVNGAVGVDISFEVTGGSYFNGDVGIGTDDPVEALQVGIEGDGTAAIANDWLTFSDKNLKKDFERLTNAKEKVQQINAYFYYWKDGKDKSRQFGLIAQEVEAVLPEIVTTSKNGVKSIDYSKVSAILIEAFKEQQAEIDNLQKQINSLKQQANNYDTLKAENEQLSKEISEMRTMMKYIIDQMHSEPSGILKTENIHE